MLLNLHYIIFGPVIVAFFYFVKRAFKLFLSEKISKNFNNGRRIANIKCFLGMKNRKETNTEIKYKAPLKKSIFLLLISLFFIFSLLKYDKDGKLAAIKVKEAIEAKNFTTVKFQKNESSDIIAYLYCGSRNCVGLDTETQEIVYFPQNGHRIQLPSPVPVEKS